MNLQSLICSLQSGPSFITSSNPELIESNNYLKFIYEKTKYLGISNTLDFSVLFGFVVFLIILFSLFLRAITTFFQMRYIYMREYSIGKKLLESYLKQPYSWFLQKNSADIGKDVLSEVSLIVNKTIFGI